MSAFCSYEKLHAHKRHPDAAIAPPQRPSRRLRAVAFARFFSFRRCPTPLPDALSVTAKRKRAFLGCGCLIFGVWMDERLSLADKHAVTLDITEKDGNEVAPDPLMKLLLLRCNPNVRLDGLTASEVGRAGDVREGADGVMSWSLPEEALDVQQGALLGSQQLQDNVPRRLGGPAWPHRGEPYRRQIANSEVWKPLRRLAGDKFSRCRG
jgi:hypothetical protein